MVHFPTSYTWYFWRCQASTDLNPYEIANLIVSDCRLKISKI